MTYLLLSLLLLPVQEDLAWTLVERLGSEELAERQAASKELAALGEKAIPVLKKVARTASGETKARAQALLDSFPAGTLAKHAESPAEYRPYEQVVAELWKLEPAALAKRLGDPDAKVRRAAAYWLGQRQSPLAPESIAAWIKVWSEDERRVPAPGDHRGTGALLAVLDGPGPDWGRAFAAFLVGESGEKARAADLAKLVAKAPVAVLDAVLRLDRAEWVRSLDVLIPGDLMTCHYLSRRARLPWSMPIVCDLDSGEDRVEHARRQREFRLKVGGWWLKNRDRDPKDWSKD